MKTALSENNWQQRKQPPQKCWETSCSILGERVQSCRWKAGYGMAARRPWGWHGLRHPQHCHNKGSGRMGPTAMSRTLLWENEMWGSQSWKCYLWLRYLSESTDEVSAWDMQLCGCRTLVIHTSPHRPPNRRARNWLGRVMEFQPTHPRPLPVKSKEWKRMEGYYTPWCPHGSQDVARAIIQAEDLQSTPIHHHNPPLGWRLPGSSSFIFLNIPETGNSFFLHKNLIIQAQKWWDLGFTPQPERFQCLCFPFHLSIFTGFLKVNERRKCSVHPHP